MFFYVFNWAKRMKTGIAKIDCTSGDVSSNLLKIVSYIDEAKESGCDVAVFPEMADTGYDMIAIKETASSWYGDPFNTLQQAAQKIKIHVICGRSENEQQTICKTTVVFSPDGKVIGKNKTLANFCNFVINKINFQNSQW